MKTSEVLRKAKHLIRTPSRWHKGNWGRRKFGNLVTPREMEDAGVELDCYCSLGAIRRVVAGAWSNRQFTSAAEMLAATVDSPVAEWNDHPSRKHKDVMAAFDEAIDTAEAKGD